MESDLEAVSKIVGLRKRIVWKFGGEAAGLHPAFVDDIRAIGDGESLSDVMVRYQYSDVLLPQFHDDTLNIIDRHGVDSGEGLVEEDELRSESQGPRNLSPTAFATG